MKQFNFVKLFKIERFILAQRSKNTAVWWKYKAMEQDAIKIRRIADTWV